MSPNPGLKPWAMICNRCAVETGYRKNKIARQFPFPIDLLRKTDRHGYSNSVCYIRNMQSCRFAFAVHVMAVLANEDKCASSASLAETVNTNPVVIRRLLIDLQNAGLIRTSRGPQGGAVLAKPPKNISLWQIHSAVESREMFGQHPNPPSPDCPVGQGIEKVLGYVERRANRSFSRELQMISLADVVRRLHRA